MTAGLLQPWAQNPTDVTTSRSRARALVDLLEATRTLVIEDDSVHALPSHALSLGEARVAALVGRDVAVGSAEGMNVSLQMQDDAAAIVRLASQPSGSALGAP